MNKQVNKDFTVIWLVYWKPFRIKNAFCVCALALLLACLAGGASLARSLARAPPTASYAGYAVMTQTIPSLYLTIYT